jgi:hypothetical protein
MNHKIFKVSGVFWIGFPPKFNYTQVETLVIEPKNLDWFIEMSRYGYKEALEAWLLDLMGFDLFVIDGGHYPVIFDGNSVQASVITEYVN